ncbi:aminoglycoside phosphotransferase family protein [Streptomyces roseirectus]|uniref:Aminoglycoside phosphotransferase family protein n=1 Tax=Streptomyces roseirectus TaxID=2768066 RepID=A0A7H0IEW5_9ACTN|nr:phosphotransferase [Streptomyces roseirectus]QNP71331.1 aminoglycoside phosphotransferase family protein [Streptomyces roseirectus]
MIEPSAALSSFVEDARNKAPVASGHHNDNYVCKLPESLARRLGQEPGTTVLVRVRRRSALPVVIRTWQDEGAILKAVLPHLPHVPTCLLRAEDFSVHSYVNGVPLSTVCGNGKLVDSRLVSALTGLLTQMTRVRRTALPPLPSGWPTHGSDSQAFLKTLAREADRQVRMPNWREFGGLFSSLGVPEDALTRFAERVPAMARRPYSLLHTDLHRDNLILPYASQDGGLVSVDWELATFGDPLQDLATHLVRMRYPAQQWDEVIGSWESAMRGARPAAVTGFDTDLRHYLDFERAQSLYPDVMRAARWLEASFTQRDLDRATREVERALQTAERPLRLRGLPGREEIERALFRWHAARHGGDVNGRDWLGKAFDWRLDTERVPLTPEFGTDQVKAVLLAEGAAGADQVFKGASHLNTVVEVAGVGFPVVVRRQLPDVRRRERRPLYEHAVLRAIHESRVPVRAPRTLALGESYRDDPFAIHTYAGPDPERVPRHPVDGLRPYEADALVDQLCALTEVDWRSLDPGAEDRDFYGQLTESLVGLVWELPEETTQLAREVGLPDGHRLEELLLRHRVTRRAPSLLHGDLNPWNLVRRQDSAEFTIIDWELALVGDPLYDLVRHMHLTPTKQAIRERMFGRWEKRLGGERVVGWESDWLVYRWLEIVRSAYIDLDRLVSREALEAPNVRRAVDSYGETLKAALEVLGLPVPRAANPYLGLALAG